MRVVIVIMTVVVVMIMKVVMVTIIESVVMRLEPYQVLFDLI